MHTTWPAHFARGYATQHQGVDLQPLPSRMPSAANTHPAGCPAQPIHTQPARAHMAPQQLRDPHSRPWTQRGPPDEHSCSHPTFSWFYVPLLLAATNRLEPQAAEAWHQTPAAGNPWRRLVEHLQKSTPRPLATTAPRVDNIAATGYTHRANTGRVTFYETIIETWKQR